ncbi:unnamed protein product [Trichogramma brassicae]|uniref:Odorant receptor n=1 Tax=Trichogramma brassicae TaxID=86971 RepID=A0A6H5I5P2_9HYME|nr:unnamed protein product [Trichogramma brassicae]
MQLEDNGQFGNYDPFRYTRLIHKAARSWPSDDKNHKPGILEKVLNVLPSIICIVYFFNNLTNFITAKTVEDISEFYAMYFIQILTVCLFVPTWVSVDFYISTFLCSLCRELNMFYDAIKNIHGKDRSHLHRIINRHIRILTYGMEVCKVVSYGFGVVHTTYGLFLIFGTIAMTQINWFTHGGLAMRNIVTIIMCMSTLSLMCFIGDLIQDLSTRLGDSIALDHYLERSNDRKYMRILEIVHARSSCSLTIQYSPTMIVNMQMYSATLNYMLSIYTFALTFYLYIVHALLLILSDGGIRFSDTSHIHRENRHQTCQAKYFEKLGYYQNNRNDKGQNDLMLGTHTLPSTHRAKGKPKYKMYKRYRVKWRREVTIEERMTKMKATLVTADPPFTPAIVNPVLKKYIRAPDRVRENQTNVTPTRIRRAVIQLPHYDNASEMDIGEFKYVDSGAWLTVAASIDRLLTHACPLAVKVVRGQCLIVHLPENLQVAK